VTNLIEYTSYVLNCMENGVQKDAIYTDFSKAFDTVSFLAWTWSYLTGREQFVRQFAGNSDFSNAQAEVDVCFHWCIDSGMQLNLGKCRHMSFQYELSSHGCDLEVDLDSKLTFTSHIDSGCKSFQDVGLLKKNW
jgi:hypothetical protein